MAVTSDRRRDSASMTRAWAAAVACGVALLAGCQSTTRELDDSVFGRGPGLEASLRGTGSAATGTVRIFDYRDGVVLQLSLFNMPVGTYRVALHERGNCRSPNLFSAGPAWAPPGAGKPPADLLPPFLTDTQGNIPSYTAFIKGARVDGPQTVRGRAVVIHWGNTIADAFPGQPNHRLACGVLDFITSPL